MEPSETVGAKKAELRAEFRGRRDRVGSRERDQASWLVCSALQEAEELRGARVIAGYVAFAGEVDLRQCLTKWRDEGVQILLPRVTGPGQMEFATFGTWESLRRGAFGIEEPRGPAVDKETIEVYLVPGLAFDRQGHRLGFGKGYYDRALPAPGQALAVGVGYGWQIATTPLPVGSHDRPMDFLATDEGFTSVADLLS